MIKVSTDEAVSYIYIFVLRLLVAALDSDPAFRYMVVSSISSRKYICSIYSYTYIFISNFLNVYESLVTCNLSNKLPFKQIIIFIKFFFFITYLNIFNKHPRWLFPMTVNIIVPPLF